MGSTSSSCVSSAGPPTAKHRETQQMRQDTPVCRHGLYIISYKYYSHTYIHIIYTHKYIRTYLATQTWSKYIQLCIVRNLVHLSTYVCLYICYCMQFSAMCVYTYVRTYIYIHTTASQVQGRRVLYSNTYIHTYTVTLTLRKCLVCPWKMGLSKQWCRWPCSSSRW